MRFDKLSSVASPVQGGEEWMEVFSPSRGVSQSNLADCFTAAHTHVNPGTAEDFRVLNSTAKRHTPDTRYRKDDTVFFFVFFFRPFLLRSASTSSQRALSGRGRLTRTICACSIKCSAAGSRPLLYLRRESVNQSGCSESHRVR